MRKVRNKSVVIAAKLPQRMTWSRPLLRKPLSGPMIVAGAGVTGHEEATSWRRLASVPNAAAVPPSRSACRLSGEEQWLLGCRKVETLRMRSYCIAAPVLTLATSCCIFLFTGTYTVNES